MANAVPKTIKPVSHTSEAKTKSFARVCFVLFNFFFHSIGITELICTWKEHKNYDRLS